MIEHHLGEIEYSELTMSNWDSFGIRMMTDPVTLTANAVATLAFEAFIKSAAGTAAKETVTDAVGALRQLRDRIWAKLAGNDRATAALTAVEQEGSAAALAKVGKYLDIEMLEEPAFAEEVRQLAQQVIQIQSQSMTTQTNINYGRDLNVINQPQGDIQIGGS